MTDMKQTSNKDNPMKLALCGCGKLHLTCGNVTFHLTRDEFLVFAESVRRLATIVAQPSPNQPTVATESVLSRVCH
jgi:hypothetical protein